MQGTAHLRVFGETADNLEWDTLTVPRPGKYRICLPTPEQASELRRMHPGGTMTKLSGQYVWMEPVNSPSS